MRITVPEGEYYTLENKEQPIRRACAAGQVPGALRIGNHYGGVWLVPAESYRQWMEKYGDRRVGRPYKS